MARWSSVSRSSNPFVSAGFCLLLAACGSTPREEAPSVAREISTPEPATDGSSATASAARPAGVTAVGAANAPGAPVPARAAQQYTEALRLMKAGRGAEAETQFKQLAAAYPDLAGPEVNLGLLYLQGSNLLEAEAAFQAALARSPANAVAGNELGIVERKLGKFSEAEAAYQRTIAADPNYAPTYLNLGVLYDLYLAEPQKALEQFEHYVQLAGDNKQVAGWLAELRKRVGAPAPAVKKEPA
jgi:tetratricopeptide (TPR) repeat protein